MMKFMAWYRKEYRKNPYRVILFIWGCIYYVRHSADQFKIVNGEMDGEKDGD